IVKLKRGGGPAKKAEATEIATDVVCPNCSRAMIIRSGRFGKFLGCSGYPECKTIVKMKKNASPPEKQQTD
ncbi:MAG TPA: topoisomerase DNA-binding C4 zinc finger domain-containing protein, partial [Syntrophales bacterium]|nr:topoisomerase DNA-binding C4 zinc finger domain-containing protein [Syntrophales bacterium]